MRTRREEKKEMAWNDSIAAIEREFCLWLNSMVRLHDGLIKIKINKEKLVGIEYFACECVCVCLRFVVVYAAYCNMNITEIVEVIKGHPYPHHKQTI